MATDNDAVPPFLKSETVELAPLYTEHWLIFTARRGNDPYWVWCPVRMTGGIDTARIRWSRPRGEWLSAEVVADLEEGRGERPSERKPWAFSEQPITAFDLPWLPPEDAR